MLPRLGSANIIQSNAIKILGVTLTENVSWDTQAEHVQSVVKGIIGVLQRFSSSLDTVARLKVFNAFILPHITYCLPVWGNGLATATSKLGRFLIQSERIILNSSAAELNESVFSSTAILPFYYLVFLKNVKHIFKLRQTETHLQYICSGLLKNSSFQSKRSREGRKFYVHRLARKCNEQFFQYKAVLDQNSQPPLLTSQTNFIQFTCTLNKYITSKLT